MSGRGIYEPPSGLWKLTVMAVIRGDKEFGERKVMICRLQHHSVHCTPHKLVLRQSSWYSAPCGEQVKD